MGATSEGDPTMNAKPLILAASLTLLGAATTATVARAQDYPPPPEHHYPDAAHIERVIGIAQNMSRTAAAMSRDADRNNRRPDDAEAAMLDRLHELANRAHRFEADAEQFRRTPERTPAHLH